MRWREDGAASHHLNALVLDLSNYLRRVCSHDELQIRERRWKTSHNFALPFWVQMKVDLIDKYYARTLPGGIVETRVGLREASRQVKDEGQESLPAVGKLTHGNLHTPACDEQSWRFVVTDVQILVSRQKPLHGLLERLKNTGSGLSLPRQHGLRSHPGGKLSETKLTRGECLCEGGSVSTSHSRLRCGTIRRHSSPRRK